MNQEIALLLQNPDWQYLAAKRLNKADADSLADLRDQVLNLYGGLLLAVLFARTVRWARAKF